MKLEHAARVRRAVVALAVTVVVASPALAQARASDGPTVHHSKAHSDRIAGVGRRAERLRGGYQLRLDEARELVRA